MTREEVDELVSSLAAGYDPAPSIPNSSHPLFAITGSGPVAPDVRKVHLDRKVHLAISNKATAELREERLRRIDLQFAVGGPSHQSSVANYDDALRWIRYRCPEKLSAGFHPWYHGERNRCIGELREKLEAGELIGVAEDGHEMLPAVWGFIEFETIPILRLRWRDLHDLWPAAFLDNKFLKPADTPRAPIKTAKKNKKAEEKEKKVKAVIEAIEEGCRPEGPYKNIPNTNEWIYRVQLKLRPDLFQDERNRSLRLLKSIGDKANIWPGRKLKKIIHKRTVDRILKENDCAKGLIATPGTLPNLGDHPYPWP